MKKIFNQISIALVLITMLSNCDGFLEEDPRSQLSPNNFYNSDAEAQLAVNGIYATYFHEDQLYHVMGLSRYYLFGSDEINPNRLGVKDGTFRLIPFRKATMTPEEPGGLCIG